MATSYSHGTSAFLQRTIDLAPNHTPKCPGLYLRISEDPTGLERGQDRQYDDGDALRGRLKWGPFAKTYPENDTSAFKKRRITLPDGSKAYRVVRPRWSQMLRDLQDGVIDGIIVYDQDRLLRQPRDLEDLIDLIEVIKKPVQGVTGSMDLMTSQGRTMARIMAAVALKSSEDTSRRVARAAVADAQAGTLVRGGPRRFGWDKTGERLVRAEAKVLRTAIADVMGGKTLTAIAMSLQSRGVQTVTGAQWTRTAVNAVLRNPRLAGIRGYQGVFHERKPTINEWWLRATRIDGEYVKGPWEALISVDEWEALQSALDGGRARAGNRGTANGASPGNPKHLLTGLVYCGRCEGKMVGRVMHERAAYGCRPRDLGGCNSVSRNLEKTDRLIIELAVRRLKKDRIKGRATRTAVQGVDEVAELERKKAVMFEQWTTGAVPDEDYFPQTAVLSRRLVEARVAQDVRANATPLPARSRQAEDLADMSGAVPLHRKRAILNDLFAKIIVMPSSRGPHFTPADIVPVWRDPE